MKKSIKPPENLSAAWLYFYVHFVTEVICFYTLSIFKGDSIMMWLFPFVYDALAFVPQSLFGYISDKFPKIKFGVIGLFLLAFSGIAFWFGFLPGKFTALAILCIGNCFTHVNGAEVTLRCSNGKLSHSAIFVSGGSFGVITGKMLAKSSIPYLPIIMLTLTGIPFALLAEYKRKEADSKKKTVCENFNYNNPKISCGLIIFIATLVVIVRGYMGYGIPTSWNKTTIQTIALYVTMGIGKALGGIFSDLFGVKRTSVISVIAALPFLLCGDNFMFISLIGVMLFSMTMSITLALLVSVLKSTPGLAFGYTTIGLFLGTAPIFFFKFTTVRSNCIIITILTFLCAAGLFLALRKDEISNE